MNLSKIVNGLILIVLLFCVIPITSGHVEEMEPFLLVSLTYPIILNSSLGAPSYELNMSVEWLAPESLVIEKEHCGTDAFWSETQLGLDFYRRRIGLAGDWIQLVEFNVTVKKTNADNESNPLYYSCIVEDRLTAGFLYYDETTLYFENQTVYSTGLLEFMLPEPWTCGGVIIDPMLECIFWICLGLALPGIAFVLWLKNRVKKRDKEPPKE